MLQHGVAGRVAEGVVDVLEAVDVDHRTSERMIVPAVADPLAVGMVEERTAVEDPGEGVDPGELAQPARERSQLRDRFVVATPQHVDLIDEVGRSGRLAPHSREIGPLDPEEAIRRADQALAAAMDQLEGERERGIVVEGQGLTQPILRGLVQRAEEILSRRHHRDGGAQPRARPHDAHLRVQNHEEIWRTLDQECVETLHVRRLPRALIGQHIGARAPREVYELQSGHLHCTRGFHR